MRGLFFHNPRVRRMVRNSNNEAARNGSFRADLRTRGMSGAQPRFGDRTGRVRLRIAPHFPVGLPYSLTRCCARTVGPLCTAGSPAGASSGGSWPGSGWSCAGEPGP